jgi:hypothetical protein
MCGLGGHDWWVRTAVPVLMLPGEQWMGTRATSNTNSFPFDAENLISYLLCTFSSHDILSCEVVSAI